MLTVYVWQLLVFQWSTWVLGNYVDSELKSELFDSVFFTPKGDLEADQGNVACLADSMDMFSNFMYMGSNSHWIKKIQACKKEFKLK